MGVRLLSKDGHQGNESKQNETIRTRHRRGYPLAIIFLLLLHHK